MYGRRYSDGIHQAIEAKEGLSVRSEDQTLATITFQNYFRLYEKLAGMTGTAKTEEREFRDIYGLDVVVMPTNQPIARKDQADIVYKSENAKFEAVVDEIIAEHEKGRPVLVGTRSIDKSERLASMLRRRGVECNVLNAKYHEQEAQIIKDAGLYGAVTIATNMAGRGVDIKLGEEVAAMGGLHIIGTERHESRRIDNQLRGRSGRQGDPGSTRFYASLEDEVMRLFGGERLTCDHGPRRFHRRDADRGQDDQRLDGARAEQGREPQLRDSQVGSRVRRRHEQAARGHLRRPPRAFCERVCRLRDFLIQTIDERSAYAVDSNAPENVHPVRLGSPRDPQRSRADLPAQGQAHGRRSREARPRRDEVASARPRARSLRGEGSRDRRPS